MKKAIVIGSTGMVGRQLIHELIQSKEYDEIVSLVRRSSENFDSKLKEYIVDFNKPESWSNLVTGDVLFSTLGTTIALAKTKEAQFKVDFSYQNSVAVIAAKNGVTHYVLISSAGANAKSRSFYLNMKGKLEEAVQALPFKVISILRPGQLAGDRIEKRFGEKVGLKLMGAMNRMGLLRKYNPIHSKLVAKAMINAAAKNASETYTLEKVFELAK